MSITASEARKQLFPLIKKVNEDHDATGCRELASATPWRRLHV
jgi:hypothetical protein